MRIFEQEMRKRLLAELDDLASSSAASVADRAPVELDQQSVGRLSRMDAMQMQAMATAAEERRRLRIGQIQAALQRIERGEYGDCVACEEPIAEKRLRADPAAHLCLRCASAR